MNAETAQALRDWANCISAEVQNLCQAEGNNHADRQISAAMAELNVHLDNVEVAELKERSATITDAQAVEAQACRIRDLVSENVRLVRAIEGLLNAYCPGADWSKPDALQSDVRRAGEAIGKVPTGGAR